MNETMPITAAKARLSELVGRLMHRGDKIFITKKGKSVAVLLPLEAYEDLTKKGRRSLLSARSALADLDAEVERMCRDVYSEREREKDRNVTF
ncbi:MAG: type II toxin-antitoxin system Phd/YefM family antitoxin [Candidatus Aminicenantales bacterium]|jgi:prevent-host-death family protein